MKKEYMVLGVVIVALILYLVFHETDRAQYQLPTMPKVASKTVTQLEIQQQGKSVVLNKRDNTWFIAPKDYPADASKIDRMLDVVDDLTLTALASEAESFSRYDLGEDKKIIVTARAGKSVARIFEIGKAVPTYQHTFIHLIDDPNVYHARGNFRTTFDKTVESLRDKTVLSFEKQQVQKIHIRKGSESREFVLRTPPVEPGKGQTEDAEEAKSPPGQEGWYGADGTKADDDTIDSLLGTLTRLKCDSYQDAMAKADLKDPLYTIRLSGAKEATLSIFGKPDPEAEQYLATSSDNDYPFSLIGYQEKNIMEKADALLGLAD